MTPLKNLLFLAALSFSFLTFSPGIKAQSFSWATTIGNTNGENVGTVATDAEGNIYYGGYFEGVLDLDPGSGVDNHTSNGQLDAYLSKLDTGGNFQWGIHIGGSTDDFGGPVTVDLNDDVFIAGNFNGTVDLNPGAQTNNVTSAGATDVFLTKFDNTGVFIWGVAFGGTSADEVKGITTDLSGNIYLCGHFSGTTDLDPGAGTNIVTSAGSEDFYVVKLNSAGVFVWGKRIGGPGSERCNSIIIDQSGQVLTTGSFSNTVDFDPGAGTQNLASAGIGDIYVSKLDSNGNYVDAVGFGGSSVDQGSSIAIDDTGNVFVTGFFLGSSDFDPGAGTATLLSGGLSDMFLAKLDTNLNYVFAFKVGDGGGDIGNSVAIDGNNNIIITGSFTGTNVDFDPDFTFVYLNSNGITDMYIAKYDASGSYVYAYSIGGTSTEVGNSVALDGSGGVITVGTYNSASDFNTDAGTLTFTPTGGSDVFVHKIVECILPSTPVTNAAMDTTCFGDSITLSVASGNLNGAANWEWYSGGCGTGSVGSGISLTILPSVSGTYSVRAEGGCALPSSCATTTVTVGTIYNMLDSMTVCQGSNFTFHDGTTLLDIQSDTSHQSVLMTAASCDSIIVTILTVEPVDAGIVLAANTLTATATNAAYQWLDCNNSMAPISNEISQSYTPDSSGNYAVAVTEGNCTDTSSCTNVIISNRFESIAFEFTIYPNPVRDQAIFSGLSLAIGGEIRIVNVNGQTMSRFPVNSDTHTFDCSQLPKGLYLVSVDSENVYSKKILVK